MATKYEFYTDTDANLFKVYGALWKAQQFTPSIAHRITYVKLKLRAMGSGFGLVTANIKAIDGSGHPTGNALTFGTIAEASLSGTATWETIEFDGGAFLAASTQYVIELHAAAGDANNYCYWLGKADGTYTGGEALSSINSGNTWNVFSPTTDLTFEDWGIAGTASSVVDKTYSKKLVAIGYNQVWYESSVDTMSVFAAANGEIDTTDVLNIAILAQKIFFANGSNLKVFDFVNTKIVTANVGTNPPDFGTVITGTSGASMIVDYITATSSACTIYGKRTTSTTFVSEDVITGTNPSTSPYGSAVSFTMTAVAEVTPPHWYDYTVFGADATNYGVMPSIVYEICKYRGRIQLSGDPNYPHQWYQSRQFNPFDFLRAAGDAQSPVAGNNADATEVGDIIKVGIPYSDDYLIYGCATELWVLSGDAAFGGEINQLDATTGILGDRAWCWDDKGNLYIAGTAGLLRIPKGFGGIENLTSELWPDFIADLAFDSSLHRITLAFDPEEHGIHIFKTTLADGICSAWWYDLRVEGLFPDAIPTAMGIYSAFYYQTESPSYRKLLVGCADGYLKSFDRATKNDDDTTINSYVGFAPLALSIHSRKDGIIKNIDLVSGGGASNGSQTDSDDVLCSVHVGRTAEQIIEKLDGSTTAAFTKTFTAPGRSKGSLDRRVIRGQWGGIVLSNNTSDESWCMERLIVDSKEAGRSL